jgi:hypothetical protein
MIFQEVVLLGDAAIVQKENLADLREEAEELTALLVASVRTAKKRK